MENPSVPNMPLFGTLEIDFSEIDGAGEESDVCGSRGDLKPPSSSGVTELWDRCDRAFPLPHNIPIQPWEAFEEEAGGGESSLSCAITDEESSMREDKSTTGELN